MDRWRCEIEEITLNPSNQSKERRTKWEIKHISMEPRTRLLFDSLLDHHEHQYVYLSVRLK